MLKAGIGEKISFMINNVAGPFVSLEEYLKLEANIFSNPWWNLKAGVDFGVGANPGLFSYFIPEWRSVLFNYEKVLSSAEDEDFLPVAKLNISPKEGVVPLKVLLDASSSESFSGVEKYYFVFGDGKAYTESEDSNDGNFDGKTLHVYEKGGIYYPEVNIWDKKGRTSKASETLETKVGWREDFENCSINTFPNNWIPDANANKSSSGIIEEGGNKILRLYGNIDGCWGALAYREKLIDPPYEIKLKIKNGDENLGGCHPSRAMIGLREGDDWSTSGKSFVSFSEEGNLLGINGEILCKTELNVWNNLKIKYDSGKIEYYLNENKIGESFYTMPNYKNLELSVNEGNAYFDDIEIMKN
jgi:hypothetical protein